MQQRCAPIERRRDFRLVVKTKKKKQKAAPTTTGTNSTRSECYKRLKRGNGGLTRDQDGQDAVHTDDRTAQYIIGIYAVSSQRTVSHSSIDLSGG